MKRIYALMLCLALLLAGCGTTKTSESSPQVGQEITVTFDFGDRTGIYIGEYDGNDRPHGYGVFTSERTDGTKWTYSGQWEHGHWNGYGSTVWENGQMYAGEYSNDYVFGYGMYNLAGGEYAIGECNDSGLNGMGMHVTPTGEAVTGKYVNGVPTGWCAMYLTGVYDGYVFWGYFEDGESSGVCYTPDGRTLNAEYRNSQLSVGGGGTIEGATDPVDTQPEATETTTTVKTWLSQNELETCQTYLTTCQYSELSEYLLGLLENEDLAESALLTDILSDCSSLEELSPKCDIQIDSIEKETTVYYKGLTEIGRTICVVPYASATSKYSTSPNYQLGFIKSGWLFFDEVIVTSDNVDSKSMSCNYYDTIHDVLSGGTISEYVYSGYLNIAPFAADSNPVIRFKNSDTKETYDHQLTDLEIEAIATISEFAKLHSSLRYELGKMKKQ